MARLSRVFADALGDPRLAFKPQAAWAWIHGTRTPRAEHRRALAMIFDVPLEELNRVLNGPFQNVSGASIVRPVIVYVQRGDRTFEYRLSLKKDIDLERPAIHQDWADIFQPPPVRLRRHFEKIRCSCFGFIHDASVSPLVRYPRSLVPLSTERSALVDVTAADKRIWFVYLPGGTLDFGIAFREGRWLHLVKPRMPGAAIRKYPLSRIDLVGYVTGRALFHVDPLPIKGQD